VKNFSTTTDSSSVILINTGRCRDKVMLGIARNIWLLCSYFNIQIKAIHIQGIDNRVADLLSRNKRYVLSCVFKFLEVPGLNAAFNTFLVFLYNAVRSFNPFSEIR
jgi:hypothetical protein